jgi:hypothetical protein
VRDVGGDISVSLRNAVNAARERPAHGIGTGHRHDRRARQHARISRAATPEQVISGIDDARRPAAVQDGAAD